MTTMHVYTAWLTWDSENWTEEMDFDADARLSVNGVLKKAKELADKDYEPGYVITGLVDVTVNEVLYNPLNAETSTEWWVSF